MRSAKIIQCRKLNDWYLCSDSLMNVTSFPSLFYLLSPKLAELVALASWLMLTCSTWMKASRREDWRSTLRYPRGQEQHRNVTSYPSCFEPIDKCFRRCWLALLQRSRAPRNGRPLTSEKWILWWTIETIKFNADERCSQCYFSSNPDSKCLEEVRCCAQRCVFACLGLRLP